VSMGARKIYRCTWPLASSLAPEVVHFLLRRLRRIGLRGDCSEHRNWTPRAFWQSATSRGKVSVHFAIPEMKHMPGRRMRQIQAQM
jgi:hypothetical protein